MKLFIFLALLLASSQAKKVPNGYITQGHDAIPHAAPSIVSLSYSEKYAHGAGGTIIANDWILTAAHCIPDPNVEITIAAGLHAQSDLNDRVQMRTVDFIKTHENFTDAKDSNDIALLHLSEPLVYNQYVQAAVLPAAGEIRSGSVHIYGWGVYNASIPKSSNILQTVETQIVDFNDCKQEYPSIVESNLCSDSLQKRIGSCTGDSGGLLYVEHDGVPSEVIGVVSWGDYPCGSTNKPSVYARVSAYIDWISKVQYDYFNL